MLPSNNATGSDGAEMISADGLDRAAAYDFHDCWRESPIDVINHTRADVAALGSLFIASGTIHSAIHFAWMAGATEVSFVGCDGRRNDLRNAVTYDPRIDVASGGRSKACFTRIRKTQDWLCKKLGLETHYVIDDDYGYVLPRRAHFVWLGDMPAWAWENIGDFERLHPGWDVHVWRSIPDDLPARIEPLVYACDLRCQQADIIRYWRLYQHGGLYFDCDMQFFRSCDDLRKHPIWACVQSDGRVNNAALGCVRHGRVMKEIVRELPVESLSYKRAKFGPDLLSKHRKDFTVLPRHYFYAASPVLAQMILKGDRDIEQTQDVWTNDTPPYAMHLWGVDGSGHKEVD